VNWRVPGVSDLLPLRKDALGALLSGVRERDGARVEMRIVDGVLQKWQRDQLIALPSKYPIHPNLVRTFQSGVAKDGSIYLITEPRYGNFHPLSAPLPYDEIDRLLAQLVPMLQEIHAMGLTHGAITPAALTHSNGRWALADAGIAEIVVPLPPPADRNMDDLLLYIAPEVLGGGPCSPAGDAFGLAATVSWLCGGGLPRSRKQESVAAYRSRIASHWDTKRRLRPGKNEESFYSLGNAPRWLADTLVRALDPTPERRALISALEPYMDNAIGRPVPEPAPLRASRPIGEIRNSPMAAPADPPTAKRYADLDNHTQNVVDRDVQFTVYRPRVAQPGRWETMLAIAHKSEPFVGPDGNVVDPAAEVIKQATRHLGDVGSYHTSVSDSGEALHRGSQLHFVPEIEGVTFNPSRASFLWLEPVHVEQFRLLADPRLAGQRVSGQVSVFYGLVLIAEVTLVLQIGVNTPATSNMKGSSTREFPFETARPYRTIFASYSHRDASIVDWFEATYQSLGDQLVRDVRHLRAGEVWSERLRAMIHDSDIFQLFWSANARTSEFVRSEWAYALDLRRDRFVRPVYWEQPMPPAPQELSRVHFTYFGQLVIAGSRLTSGGLINPAISNQRQIENVPHEAAINPSGAYPTELAEIARSNIDVVATAALIISVVGLFMGAVILNAVAMWLSRRALRGNFGDGRRGVHAARARVAFHLGAVGLIIWAAAFVGIALAVWDPIR